MVKVSAGPSPGEAVARVCIIEAGESVQRRSGLALKKRRVGVTPLPYLPGPADTKTEVSEVSLTGGANLACLQFIRFNALL